jgi:hypothetical protein
MIGGPGNDIFVFDLSAPRPTSGSPTAPPPVQEGTVYISAGQGYANTLVGIGPAGIAVDLFSKNPQQFFDPNGLLLLTLILNNPGQVQFSY